MSRQAAGERAVVGQSDWCFFDVDIEQVQQPPAHQRTIHRTSNTISDVFLDAVQTTEPVKRSPRTFTRL